MKKLMDMYSNIVMSSPFIITAIFMYETTTTTTMSNWQIFFPALFILVVSFVGALLFLIVSTAVICWLFNLVDDEDRDRTGAELTDTNDA